MKSLIFVVGYRSAKFLFMTIQSFFGVDAGLACFADARASEDSRLFFEKWQQENPGKNKYEDYFAPIFRKSFEENPKLQNAGGNFCIWQLPETGERTILFSSGVGDGMYSGYWGLDEEGEAVCLAALFMNPEFF